MYTRSGGNGRGQNSVSNSGCTGMASAITPMVKNYQTVVSSSSDGTDWNSLNPNLYQNMSNDQVDWAALAQQWIQMKETLPPEMVPAAPPPPVISWNRSPPSVAPLETIDEQGEAPMEVEKEEDPGLHPQPGAQLQQSQTGTWQNGSVAWQYPITTSHSTSEWRNPAWENNWSTGSSEAALQTSTSSVPVVNPQASVAVANWQAKISRIYNINDGGASSEPIAGSVQPVHSQQGDGSKRIPGLMDQVINLDPGSNEGDQGNQDVGEDTTQTINDAKRKLLPAWIREGLEKMEREKQRQVEREREQKHRDQLLEQRRQAELEALSELDSSKKKSKFESDSDEEEEEAVDGNEREGASGETSPAPARSREEILQELMISVRKNLTEILLEVTNEEITVLAKETLAKTRRKAPKVQALRKTGLATLTGGLGLGIYGDSDDDEDDDDDGSGSEKGRNSSGGENEEDDEDVEKALRSTIKQRQKEFEWTAREIEDQLAQEEAREERKRREYEQQQKQLNQDQNSEDEDAYGNGRTGFGHTPSGTAVGGGSVSGGKSGSRDGETQPVNDKIYAHKLGRTRDKRISRFSDPKDTVRQTHITHVAIVTHKPGEIMAPALHIPKAGQMIPAPTMVSSGISPPVVLNPTVSAPLFPAAVIGAGMESYRRENSVASEAPSTSSRASSSHRSGRREKSSSSSSRHKSSHKSHKKHKRSRYSRSDDEDDENDCYVTDERDDDRYSQYSSSRRSRSSERSSHSRRHRRSYSKESRDGGGGSRRYRSSRRSQSRSRSPLSRRGRY